LAQSKVYSMNMLCDLGKNAHLQLTDSVLYINWIQLVDSVIEISYIFTESLIQGSVIPLFYLLLSFLRWKL
jgi:hypothetical protein